MCLTPKRKEKKRFIYLKHVPKSNNYMPNPTLAPHPHIYY
jgi:hypothetical protein